MAIYLIFILISAVFSIAFSPTLLDLLARWLTLDGSQSHGIIIVGLFLLLTLDKLKRLPSSVGTLNLFGSLALLVCSFAWFVAANLNIETIEQLLLLPIIFFLCWGVLGVRNAFFLLPCIALLIFAIPIWGYLTPYLVQLSSAAVTFCIELTDITVLIDGNSIYLPYGRIDIADGCSGLRYLTISIALAFYIILTSKINHFTKFKLIAASITLGLLTNWLRIYILVMVADFTQMESGLVKDHEMFGWLLFIVVSAPLLFYIKKLPALDSSKLNKNYFTDYSGSKLAACFFALLIGPLLFLMASSVGDASFKGGWEALGYQETDASQTAYPHMQPKSQVNLLSSDGFIATELAIHWRQSREDDMVPYIGEVLNRNLWSKVKEETVYYKNNKAKLTLFREKPYGKYACTLSWYGIGSFETTSYYMTKLLQIPASLLDSNGLFLAVSLTKYVSEESCQEDKLQLIKEAIKIRQDIRKLTL